MVLKIFSQKSIDSLLDILFNDMKGDYKNLEGKFVESDDDGSEEEMKEDEMDDHESKNGSGGSGE